MPRRRGNPNRARVPSEGVRAWQPREMEMVSEYLATFYPQAFTMTRVRLGSIPHSELLPLLEDHEVRTLSVFRRWADGIAVTDQALVLIEGVIRPSPAKIAQLQLYRRLIPHTPELQQYLPRAIEMELLYAIEDPLVVIMAREAGIKPVFFRTRSVAEYIKRLMPRERRAPKVPPEVGG